MNDIVRLLITLQNMYPLSDEFKKLISSLLSKKELKNYHVLLKPDALAKKAWYLIRGFVIVKGNDPNNNMTILYIYFPGQIITDLPGFFEGQPVKHKYIAIKKAKVLELTKLNFEKLQVHPETHKLVQHIMLSELKMERAKAEMLILPDTQRVETYLSNFKLQDFPDKYSAAFVKMPVSVFKAEKAKCILAGISTPSTTDRSAPHLKTSLSPIYGIKAHIHEHFKLKEIEKEVVEMMSSYTATRKTMERNFSKTFGITADKLIIKLKLELAKLLLRESEMSPSEVCKEVGYEDIYNFGRNFKKKYGYHPNKIRLKD